LNKVVALTMRSVTWNRFPIKKLVGWYDSSTGWRLVTWAII